ncbi:YcnI family protein [Paenibacillus sp. sptzw28]|uniref:YcnI family copper-binding membrane protein n=1 Tax=Paenibacillus sp. sptzw28 TaxID=715179 RepID=UPI001C6E62B3|nr:YcnI family protein [Paenibacillus sp. sptzw28]QYR22917.1 YcnI family protein [Paenibacillus sp. sptzw28]
MIQRKKWPVAGIALLSLFLFAGLASAHVTVQPSETKQGSYEVFTVRVPSEEENVTTKSIRVKVPEGVAVSRTQPKPGWKTQLETAADGSITSITWTADGPGLSQTEFDEFRVQGKVAADAKELIWKAYQTYSDNKVVEWTGAAGSDYPASVTTVMAGTGGNDGHGGASAPAADGESAAVASDGHAADTAAGTAAGSGSGTMEAVTLAVTIAALVLSVAALITALAKRRKA